MSDKIDLAEIESQECVYIPDSEIAAFVRVVRAATVIHRYGPDTIADDWIELAEALSFFTDSSEKAVKMATIPGGDHAQP